ncbi:aminodeoxychorismate lyase [Lysobacter terrae]
MSVRIFAGGMAVENAVDAVSADDRGLAYGDGVFETMRAVHGDVPWWTAHCERLRAGLQRLGIVTPDLALDLERAHTQAIELLAGDDAVLKLIVTRGRGGRGYALPAEHVPTWILSRHPLPPSIPGEGIAVRWCRTRLAVQPALAGVKHCNRLEQVLARAEWDAPEASDRDAFEGLMCSSDGDVVCATAANLFVRRGGRWITPPVDRCGVAGICRGWLMAELRAEERRLDVTDVETADAVFLCNAVRGILPVARLGERRWPPDPHVAGIRERLGAAHPAFLP